MAKWISADAEVGPFSDEEMDRYVDAFTDLWWGERKPKFYGKLFEPSCGGEKRNKHWYADHTNCGLLPSRLLMVFAIWRTLKKEGLEDVYVKTWREWWF